MAVYVAVCEIFSVKEWRDLENQVGRSTSRSLKWRHVRLSLLVVRCKYSSILYHFRVFFDVE